jgi:cyclopropane fatty-acyl-phospholipid synthase-like methyltransferase
LVAEELLAFKDHLGEGLATYTRKAFRMLPRIAAPRVLEIGCGSGVPKVELAVISDREITAIDTSRTSLDRLARRVKTAGLEARVTIENRSI